MGVGFGDDQADVREGATADLGVVEDLTDAGDMGVLSLVNALALSVAERGFNG